MPQIERNGAFLFPTFYQMDICI